VLPGGRRIRSLWVLKIVGAAALILVLVDPDGDRIASAQIVPSHPPRFPHVAVLILENREYRDVIGNPAWPYVNGLADRYGLDTGYFAVSHPSLPNYLALTGGSTFGIRSDCAGCRIDGMSLFDQLNAAGITWRAYFEKTTHRVNPFRHYANAASAVIRSQIVPFARLSTDIHRHRLPQFAWLGLGLCHDGHSCSASTSDRYLSHLIPPLIRALGSDGVLFITWDEGTTKAGGRRPAGGHVPLIAAGAGARAHARSPDPANHYALLRTIADSFGVPPLRNAATARISALTSLLRRAP
jgi:phosphatidylinositol-3-phosphatase